MRGLCDRDQSFFYREHRVLLRRRTSSALLLFPERSRARAGVGCDRAFVELQWGICRIKQNKMHEREKTDPWSRGFFTSATATKEKSSLRGGAPARARLPFLSAAAGPSPPRDSFFRYARERLDLYGKREYNQNRTNVFFSEGRKHGKRKANRCLRRL